MTLSLKQKLGKFNHFSKKQSNKEKIPFKSWLKEVLSKFSRGIFYVIAIMPIAGLLLGIGATITTNAHGSHAIETFGAAINSLGSYLFDSLGLFFAIGIAISFTGEKAYAAFAAALGYFVFSYIQSPFITQVTNSAGEASLNILFYKGVDTGIQANFVGAINCLQTSVFGGMIVGGVVAFIYNKLYRTQLPLLIQFFSGERTVGVVAPFVCGLLGFIMILIWPPIAIGLTAVGKASSSLPIGLDSFFFGIIERVFVPFGLHHVFYSPLWWTSAGGYIGPHYAIHYKDPNTGKMASEDFTTWLSGHGFTYTNYKWAGDQTLWMTFNELGLPFSTSDTFYFTETINSTKHVNLNLGRFLYGKYPGMIFGLTGAALAMIMAAEKDRRKEASAIIISAGATSFLLGITEPIEYTFLLLAPLLFFGFHALMMGVGFWIMHLVGANVGMTLSGGAIDLIIYGILPTFNHSIVYGQSITTGWWWVLIFGCGYFPLYYFVFYWYIKKKDIATPGRGGNVGAGMKLGSKAEYRANADGTATISDKKAIKKAKGAIDYQTLVDQLGGKDNISSVTNCASRLRVQVKDLKQVKEGNWAPMVGAFGMQKSGKEIQVIYGNLASVRKVELEDFLKTI